MTLAHETYGAAAVEEARMAGRAAAEGLVGRSPVHPCARRGFAVVHAAISLAGSSAPVAGSWGSPARVNGRTMIAMQLGISPETLNEYLSAAKRLQMPSGVLIELLVRDDVLPEAARDWLWRELGHEAGYVVVPVEEALPAGEGSRPPLERVARMAESVGSISAGVLRAQGEDSESGIELSPAERRELLDGLRALQEHTTAAIEALSADDRAP